MSAALAQALVKMVAQNLLIRYGAIPVVARFRSKPELGLARGMRAVVRTGRGLELGTVLEPDKRTTGEPAADEDKNDGDKTADQWTVLRVASDVDEATSRELRGQCETEFATWRRRIAGWNLDLELIDLEWTLDRNRLVLYVLNERGPDCTKLALQAAAAGFGIVEVQPVDAAGLVQLETGGGCGSGGCGSGGCGS
jgi:cell fate regulator YaaT (PSP1 superfamily)